MKKEQKITELRTAAKLKVAVLRTKIAFARSEAAEKKARVLTLRANVLKGMEANSTERLDAIAKYAAIMAGVNAQLETYVAQLKAEIQQVKAECEQQCAAAEDNPETEKEQTKQETVYCDGSEHSARIVARRLINKMPRVKCDGALFVHIICDDNGDYFVSVSEQNKKPEDYISTIFSKDGHCEKSEAQFVERAREMFKADEDEASATSTAQISSALDALFCGNPLEQVENLISDTDKYGNEGEDE